MQDFPLVSATVSAEAASNYRASPVCRWLLPSLVKMVPLELGELSVYRGWVSWSSLGYPLGGPVGGYAVGSHLPFCGLC